MRGNNNKTELPILPIQHMKYTIGKWKDRLVRHALYKVKTAQLFAIDLNKVNGKRHLT